MLTFAQIKHCLDMKRFITILFACVSVVSLAQKPTHIRQKGLENLFPFYHGVASGDPLEDRVILWTRVTSENLQTDPIPVKWRVATDTSMQNVVLSGETVALAENDFTVKVDAIGLSSDQWYYYEFEALDHYSLKGRTRTLPTGQTDSLRFGVVSCSNYEQGYFSAYRHLNERNDVDFILHLGDYIYEYEVGGYSSDIPGRTNEPTNEIITLEDYRMRHSHYKLDEDLRAIHQNYPFITVWDDHESANDSYVDGAENHDPATEGPWEVRKAISAKVYYEWMPIRYNMDTYPSIYRQFKFGNLLDLNMVDTRIEARSQQGGDAEAQDPNRTLFGDTQFNWLKDNLTNSTQTWKVMGNQVMFAPLEILGTPLNYDQWDGYAYERNQLLTFLDNNDIRNFLVLTGDIHTSWVNDIPMGNYDKATCTGSAGVEFVVTSVTSAAFPASPTLGTEAVKAMNPHMNYIELAKKGYAVLDLNQIRAQFDFYYVSDVEDPQATQSFGVGYRVYNQESCAQKAIAATTRLTPNPSLAPEQPAYKLVSLEEQKEMAPRMISILPNPTTDETTVQYYVKEAGKIEITLVDAVGRVVFSDSYQVNTAGVQYMKINLSEFPEGTYLLQLQQEDSVGVARISKKN